MVEEKQLENVTPYGRIDKEAIRRLLYDCDALVLASRSEVQPLVLLEAMSTGIPVVSTECVPRNQRIEGGCFIVPIDDAPALARQMETVMQMEDFDGKRVSEQIRQMASPQVIGKQLEEIFTRVVKGQS
jgi:glycosyltransferase involved in cell wall biosynthesis